MDYADIRVASSDGAVTITLDRPRARNAVSFATCGELTAAITAAGRDPGARVIVLAHTGPYFSSGGDLAGYTGKPQAQFREYTQAFKQLLVAIFDSPRPVVAQVKGSVLGGGIGIVAACDLVVSSSEAVYRCPEIDVGLWPMMVSPILMRAIGARRALDLMLTGRAMSAADAAAAGLVSRVVAPDGVDAEVAAVVTTLKAKSPLALAMGRRSFHVMADMEMRQALEYTGELLSLLVFSRDGQEGVRAFLEKRKAAWLGH
jgi:enoyl-CoA hydratase/carnithine racemase